MSTVQKLEALPSIFNDEKGTVRLLLLLSPTCSECLRGASKIKEHVLEKIGNDDVRVYAVWLPILSADKLDRVVVATRRLADPRVRHFWDGAAKLSAEYPRILNFEDDRPGVDLYSLFRRLLALYNDLFQCASNDLPAWDVYLLFDRRAQWQDEPPAPSFWMHQLTLSKAKRLKGPAFAREVIRLLADA